MKKIMVVGVSAGAGKSTFARRLGKTLDLPVIHLDTLYWKPGWIEAAPQAFAAAVQAAADQPEWIIEGNYSSTFAIRLARADAVIYLERPLALCLYRVLKRWYTNKGKTRPDMGAGCEERMEWAFLKFIVTTYRRRKRTMRRLLEEQKNDKIVVRLTSENAIEQFLLQAKK
ncbi:MAG TPA: topology modulation protein [Bacillales bacterium]|nr:topology modulation protein [Bacillales bacterium]